MPKDEYAGPDARFATTSPGPHSCPNPDHRDSTPSFHIYPDGGYCFGCGHSESAIQIIVRLGKRVHDVPAFDPTVDPPGHVSRSGNGSGGHGSHQALVAAAQQVLLHPDSPFRDRQDWFRGRGFTDASIRRFRFGYWPDSFIIPIWRDGCLVGAKTRRDDEVVDPGEDPNKYRNLPGSGLELVRANPGSEGRVVVEGELDAYLLTQYGLDAITTTNGGQSIPRELQRHRLNYGEVFVIPDVDETGESMLLGLMSVWNGPVRVIRLKRGKDIGEELLSYPERSRKGALQRLLMYAEDY